MSEDKIVIFDTTLRDGEQSAGIGMTGEEKLEIARQLTRLRIDVIEAGFAASSPGDFQAVKTIAREIKGPVIASLARAHPADVDQAWEALKGGENPRIHVFLSSSDIHLMHQIRKNREEVMDMAVSMVSRARGYCDNIEFSPMGRHQNQPRVPLPAHQGGNRCRRDHGKHSGYRGIRHSFAVRPAVEGHPGKRS